MSNPFPLLLSHRYTAMNVKGAQEVSVDVDDNGIYSMWYTIHNLIPHTRYAIEIRGWNRNGEGPFNRYVFFYGS